jgi:hypothetical protein
MSLIEKWGVKLLLALIILVIHTAFRPIVALGLSIFVLGGVVWYGAWIAFFYTGYRASAVPLLVGIIMEQLATSAETAQHLLSEIEHPEKLPASWRK